MVRLCDLQQHAYRKVSPAGVRSKALLDESVQPRVHVLHVQGAARDQVPIKDGTRCLAGLLLTISLCCLLPRRPLVSVCTAESSPPACAQSSGTHAPAQQRRESERSAAGHSERAGPLRLHVTFASSRLPA